MLARRAMPSNLLDTGGIRYFFSPLCLAVILPIGVAVNCCNQLGML